MEIEILLNSGADVNAQDMNMDSALLIIAKDTLIPSAEERANLFKILLKHNVNLNITDEDGKTALHYIARQKLITITKILLEHGARYDIADKEGKTALTILPGFGRKILSIAESLKSKPSK